MGPVYFLELEAYSRKAPPPLRSSGRSCEPLIGPRRRAAHQRQAPTARRCRYRRSWAAPSSPLLLGSNLLALLAAADYWICYSRFCPDSGSNSNSLAVNSTSLEPREIYSLPDATENERPKIIGQKKAKERGGPLKDPPPGLAKTRRPQPRSAINDDLLRGAASSRGLLDRLLALGGVLGRELDLRASQLVLSLA